MTRSIQIPPQQVCGGQAGSIGRCDRCGNICETSGGCLRLVPMRPCGGCYAEMELLRMQNELLKAELEQIRSAFGTSTGLGQVEFH